MERSEPSLVPEWLKGAGGGGGAAHHSQPPIHQDEGGSSFLSRQRSQPAAVNHGDYDSPRYSAASDRAFYPSARRGGATNNNSTGASERPLFERDPYPRAYSSFGRSSGYRGGYDGSLDREREGPRDRDRDWDWERERERDFRDRERDRALGFGGGDDRDRDRDRSDVPNFRRPSLGGAAGRYESEVPLRRSQSMVTSRVVENGDKKATADVGALPTAPPANIGTLTSSMQKAAFERNFPSLGAQEKQGVVVQSSLGNVSVLSPRPSWQSSSPRPEGVRSASSAAGSASVSVAASVNVGGSVIGGEGWSSALAEVPSSLTGLTSTMNGIVSGASSAPAATSGVASALSSIAAQSLIVPKMSEALAQHPPRVRTPPQFPLESPRVEEAAAKQPRQLVLMKPSLPKNTGPRDITKPKVVRAADFVAPQPTKLTQPLASQLVSSPYRPPAPPRPEPLKVPPGKLLGRKTSKEAVAAVLSPSSSLKGDAAGSTSVISAAGALVGMGGANLGTNAPGASAPAPRNKQKQLLDRRAVPIPPISVPMGSDGSGPRSKESGSASEDKRPPIPAQNRSDFFNALRKKAAGIGISGGTIDKMETGALQKNDGLAEKGVEAEEDAGPFAGDVSQMTESYQPKENGTAANAAGSKSNNLSNSDGYAISDTKDDAPANGASTEGAEGNSEQSSTAPNSPVAAPANRATATEEEEAAFLRSLGWEESAEESGEGLTEEEINAFYQERLRSMSISPSLPNARNHRLRDVRVDLHVGSIGSISSGMSSSDTESDDDLRVHSRS